MPNRNIVGDYRYNYQGQELDPETGKVAFELRLYDPRINRWLTTDPYNEFHSPYLAMGNNWVRMIDPDGGKTDDIIYLDADGNETHRFAMDGPDIYFQETYEGGIQDGLNVGYFKEVNFSKELGGVVPDKINFATMTNNQIVSLAVDWYALINQRETKPNGELFNVTDFVEPEFRKSRNPFGSMTVDGPEVTGNYNGGSVKFTVVDKSFIRENNYDGDMSYFRFEPLEMKGFRSQYRISSKDQKNYTNTSLLMYDKDIYNQVKATMRGNH